MAGRPVRYYSYARYALQDALRLSGVKQGEIVALPGLICGELLAALHDAQAVPRFYPVSEDLRPDLSSAWLSDCRVVVAVNYFGFAQDLELFRALCRRTGATLVEDNAHGLFSRDQQGLLLGTRGDFGLFSLRKTLMLPNGAALVINLPHRWDAAGPQLPFDQDGPPLQFRVKQAVRQLAPFLGAPNLSRLIAVAKAVRRRIGWDNGSDGQGASETTLPLPAQPSRLLARPLWVDPTSEAARRRALYEAVGRMIAEMGSGVSPVFPSLPPQVVPYGYPFYARPSAAVEVGRTLDAFGLDCLAWPQLPQCLRDHAPAHYREIHLVPFQW